MDYSNTTSEISSLRRRLSGHPADSAASIISWILVPLMMPFYATLIYCLFPLSGALISSKIKLLLFILGINAVLPMLLVYLLKLFGLVHDVGLNNRRERLIPYIITVVAFAGSAWFMASQNAHTWFVLFFLGGAIAGLINFIINFRWKVSAHAAGVAGMVAILIRTRMELSWEPNEPLLDWIIITWILLSGLLGSARIWLGRHTLGQVLAGYAIGFLSVYLTTLI